MKFFRIPSQQLEDEAKAAKPGHRVRLTWILAWLTILLGAVTVVAAIHIGIRGYSPVLFADEWTMPMDTISFGGHYPLSKLWEQHNEHRIPFQKLLEMFSMEWFQDDQRFPFVLNWVVQAAMCVTGAFFLKRLSGFAPVEWLTAVGLLLFCVFNPASMQIFVWGMGPSLLASFASCFASLAALTMYRIRLQDGHRAWRWLIFSLAAAFFAETNLASGAFVWLLLPVTAFLLGFRIRAVAAFSAVGILGIGIYLIGYQTPSNASSPLDALKNIPQVLAFVEAHLGQTWNDVWPQAGDSLAGIALIAFLVFTVVLFLFRPKRTTLEVFAWSLGALMLMTSLVMALGRQNVGVAQAREGRYQVSAILFWYAAALVLIAAAGRLGRWRSNALIALQFLFCTVMTKDVAAFPGLAKLWAFDSYQKNIAGLSVELGVNDLPAIRRIYPDPPMLIPAYRSMTSVGLIKPPFPEIEMIGKRLNKAFPASQIGCSGAVQSVKVVFDGPLVRDIAADGTFVAPEPRQAIKRVFATSEGLITGFGVTNEDRWHLVASLPKGVNEFFIYALEPDGQGVCLPSLTAKIPDLP
jgi:hypothetical protein